MAARFALLDSGLGVLPTAACLRRSCPDATLILSMDPDGMPWGSRQPHDITERLLRLARATLSYSPDVVICASNTGSLYAIDALRDAVDPVIPVIGTEPALESAAAAGKPVAIWVTAATSASPRLASLLNNLVRPGQFTQIACPGFADAVETGDGAIIAAAVADMIARTPKRVRHVLLGCTQYELAAPWITAALPDVRLYGSARTVAAQALRRASHVSRVAGGQDNNAEASCTGGLHVLMSGRQAELPSAARSYAEGRLVAAEPNGSHLTPGFADGFLPVRSSEDQQCQRHFE